MRTHGWSGSAPATDDEAVARILAAAGKAIDERGADFSIADVARTLGVTRQTVYRYFPSTDALLVAAAVHAASDFLERLAAHLQGITDPAEAVTEAIATALEWLPKDKHIGLLVVPGRADAHTESVTSDVALQFANAMLRRFDVDWAARGFTDADLDELAEHLLRIIQSFVIDPGRPPRTGEDLRAYLRRWVGGADFADIACADPTRSDRLLRAGGPAHVSALDAFMTTWSQARATFGARRPADGAQFDQSAQLQAAAEPKSTPPHRARAGRGPRADSYAEANSKQARTLGEHRRTWTSDSAPRSNAPLRW